jgi:EmrB/QacA subfamily drug resistance transporter
LKEKEERASEETALNSKINWLLLSNVMLGNFLAGAAGRIFNISLPTVANALGTDIVGVSWALLAYQLSSIGLALVFGKLGDIYGRVKVYAWGYVVFTAGSLLCGLSQNILQLILARLVQGVGGAMTQSTGRALASESMPERQAGKAQSLMTTAFHSGFLLGPSLGGLIIEYVHWRGIFFFLVPIGIVGSVLTFWNMKGSNRRSEQREVDYLGATLLVALATSLIALLDHRTKAVMGSELTLLMYVVFAASLAGFVIRETRTPDPIFNLALFKIRMFAFSCVTLLIVSVSHSLTGFILPFYLQEILGVSPAFMGLLFMAAPILTIISAPISGYLVDRVGPRLPATVGVAVIAASVLIGTTLRVNSHWWLPATMLALTGLSTGLFNTPNHVAIIYSVPSPYRGSANGTIHLMFNMGHILGISLGSFFMTRMFQLYTGLTGARPTPSNPTAFVASLNYTYGIALAFVAVAFVTSLMRGPKAQEGMQHAP